MAACSHGTSDKPKVLILGGVGFVGRNLTEHLVTNDLASKIRVADKVMPQMAWLNKSHKDAFSQVEFKHANLINPASASSAFHLPNNEQFDLVVNCAGETKLGQSESVYRDGIYKLSMNCATEAAKRSVACYIEISTAMMHSSDTHPITEDTECEPFTLMAKYKLAVEQDLRRINGLNYIIVRPAIVYGLGDKSGLTPKVIIASIYKSLREKMKLLWNRDLKMNTVHVLDVCRAIWHLYLYGQKASVYHLADKSDTNQGLIGDLVSEIFDINVEYLGSLASNFAKMDLDEIVLDVNDKHMTAWVDACQRDSIHNTPINPHLDKEQLQGRHVFVNGSKIERTGFMYERPKIDRQLLLEVLEDFMQLGLFPPSLLGKS